MHTTGSAAIVLRLTDKTLVSLGLGIGIVVVIYFLIK